MRVLRLTREDEKGLLYRLENLSSLSDLRRLQERMSSKSESGDHWNQSERRAQPAQHHGPGA